MGTTMISRRIDERGKICPEPMFDTCDALGEMAPGEVLEVVCDYYPTRQAIPVLMAELGYPCELVDADKPVFRFIIRKV